MIGPILSYTMQDDNEASYTIQDDNEADRQAAQQLAMRRLYQYITLFISILITALTGILQQESHHSRQPYHTSVLTGEGWVMELLTGSSKPHPV